jgi:hypothetical protein
MRPIAGRVAIATAVAVSWRQIGIASRTLLSQKRSSSSGTFSSRPRQCGQE